MPEFITDDGVSLHYSTDGIGPTCLICVHWMGGNAGDWDELFNQLDRRRIKHVAIDLRGHGKSQPEPCTFTAERIARDVLNLADKLHIGRFVIAGHSFGGKVALRLATLAPQRLIGVILIGTVGPGLVPMERPVIAEILRRAQDAEFIRNFFRPWFKLWPLPKIDEAIISFGQTPLWALQAVCECAMWTDLSAETAGITTPVLAIAGADDPVYGPAYQMQAVQPFVPEAKIVTIPECGHGLILEQPQKIAAEIETFLS